MIWIFSEKANAYFAKFLMEEIDAAKKVTSHKNIVKHLGFNTVAGM